MRRAMAMATLAMVTLIPCSQANAYIATVTYQGHIESINSQNHEYSFDYDGLFGLPNTNLVGQSFLATFVLDTGSPYDYFEGDLIGNRGGPAYGGPNPVLYSGITINGQTQAVSPDYYSDYFWYRDRPYYNGLQIDSSSMKSELSLNAGWTPDVYTPFAGVFSIPVIGDGWFGFYQNDITSHTGLIPRAEGRLTVERISYYSSGSTVPEPATWAMMIIGFGLAGSALRRRRVTAAA